MIDRREIIVAGKGQETAVVGEQLQPVLGQLIVKAFDIVISKLVHEDGENQFRARRRLSLEGSSAGQDESEEGE